MNLRITVAEMGGAQICASVIRRDDEGRYCLNDLHRASGGAKRHTPGRFTLTKQFRDLAAEISLNRDIAAPVTSVQKVGTFVAKELVYAYAMWISPKFALKVIRSSPFGHPPLDEWRSQAHEETRRLPTCRPLDS